MVIKPKRKKFLCINSHPLGCAANVQEEITRAKALPFPQRPLTVLILGASSGYGLSSRIVSAFGMGANTLGVYYARPPEDQRVADAGWYNTLALAQELKKTSGIHHHVNRDAFSLAAKQETAKCLRDAFPRGVDLLIYSIAAPRRLCGDRVYRSTIKPLGAPVETLDMDPESGMISKITVAPATKEEADETRKVMGGEDWLDWVHYLKHEGLLNEGAKTFAYTYIGSELTRGIYNAGTIGYAKDHLLETARWLNDQGILQAHVVSQPAVVTQSSAVIPSISLYMTLLMKLYEENHRDNSCVSHIARMMEHVFYLQVKTCCI